MLKPACVMGFFALFMTPSVIADNTGSDYARMAGELSRYRSEGMVVAYTSEALEKNMERHRERAQKKMKKGKKKNKGKMNQMRERSRTQSRKMLGKATRTQRRKGQSQ